jgi:hypothetical protein
MTRSELKQLIRETIEEISADTARRAADKAAELGRYKQSDRLQRAAAEKDTAAIGGDPYIDSIDIGNEGETHGEIIKLGKTEDGRPAISVKLKVGGTYTLVDNDPHITTVRGHSVRVGRQDRIKLVKAFKSMGVNINANKINILEK